MEEIRLIIGLICAESIDYAPGCVSNGRQANTTVNYVTYQELKKRKKEPLTTSHARRPPLGISSTLGSFSRSVFSVAGKSSVLELTTVSESLWSATSSA